MKHQGQTTSETIWIVSLGSVSLGSMALAALQGVSARLSRASQRAYTVARLQASSMLTRAARSRNSPVSRTSRAERAASREPYPLQKDLDRERPRICAWSLRVHASSGEPGL